MSESNLKAHLSDKRKVYLFLPYVQDSCYHNFIYYLKTHLHNSPKFNRTLIYDDQSMIPEEIRDRFYWFANIFKFDKLPDDNFIIKQNVGDLEGNRLKSWQITIFIDEEFLPIIKEAIQKAQDEADKINAEALASQHREAERIEGVKKKDKVLAVPEKVEVWTCDPRSDDPKKNPIRHYHKDFNIQYPNVEWFL